MKKLSLKMVALIAAMMMCLTAEAKTEDVGGRVIVLSTSYNIRFVVQKCWLKDDALCLRASISDVFQRSVQDVAQD